MEKHEIFSKRQKRIQGAVPDVYQYDIIPKELRVQIFYIWQKSLGKVYYNDFEQLQVGELTWDAYSFNRIPRYVRSMVYLLIGEEDSAIEIVRDFLIDTEDIEKIIDVIEVSFRYIDQQIRDYHDEEIPAFLPVEIRNELSDCMHPDKAIDELNNRFREHGVGYQYESGPNNPSRFSAYSFRSGKTHVEIPF